MEVEEILSNYPDDTGLWTEITNDSRRYWTQNGPEKCNNIDSDFKETKISYLENKVTKYRYLTKAMFQRTLKNGENVTRDWMIYSPEKKMVYCFVCRLISNSNTKFISGFNDWKHGLEQIAHHESSCTHHSSMLAYIQRKKHSSQFTSQMTLQFQNEKTYWTEVLRRIAFRGADKTVGSIHNGNYLGILELISNFDPFLYEHLKQYGNPGKGNVSYLSANICEEFISISYLLVL